MNLGTNSRHSEFLEYVERKVQEYQNHPACDPELIKEIRTVKKDLIGCSFRIVELEKEVDEFESRGFTYHPPSWWDGLLDSLGLTNKSGHPHREAFVASKELLLASYEKELGAKEQIETAIRLIELEVETYDDHPEWLSQ
jgi:hypothetical protein